jgi:TonB family protein
VYRIGRDVSAPKVIQKKDPEYSEEARLLRWQGTTALRVVVGTDGAAHDVHVMRYVGFDLDAKAIEAVSEWKFKPGEKGGVPVPVLANIEVNWGLLPSKPVAWQLTNAKFNQPDGVSRPVVIKAEYPPFTLTSGSDQGPITVTLSFDVDTNGIPIDFHASSTSDQRWAAEVIRMVSGWQFRPGMKNGSPVSVPCMFDFKRLQSL